MHINLRKKKNKKSKQLKSNTKNYIIVIIRRAVYNREKVQ